MEELPTERTDMRMTTFMIEGRTVIPASLMAMTKGEVAALALPPWSRRGSS
jgi:hypothetical protein